ncbi:hypothetical protein Tdes44962_MAKER08977 [Teratosphaeria destructans]|uniref:Uncharacterized protein n=1 Tax=Teratosphaeria destructans TaxID=418781 RepID=A0A9W7SV38_9PEZI|nr:hypothetical protein Tdes44962_MAKER08977 [Teratosphaeria destructans]
MGKGGRRSISEMIAHLTSQNQVKNDIDDPGPTGADEGHFCRDTARIVTSKNTAELSTNSIDRGNSPTQLDTISSSARDEEHKMAEMTSKRIKITAKMESLGIITRENMQIVYSPIEDFDEFV